MKPDTQKTIASNLRTLRTSKDLRQAQVASFAGISRSLYTHYELGSRTQDAEVLYIISNRLGIDMSILFEKDHKKFLSQLASKQTCDEVLVELMSLYRQLSPSSRGILMEKATSLVENEESRDENQTVLKDMLPV